MLAATFMLALPATGAAQPGASDEATLRIIEARRAETGGQPAAADSWTTGSPRSASG
jgi:hypothetical protein